jgi:hypothetical protein
MSKTQAIVTIVLGWAVVYATLALGLLGGMQ